MSYMGPDQNQGNLPPNSVPAGVLQAASVGYPNLDATITSLFRGKNRIINGDCRVAQRAPFVSIGTAGFGGPDRYNANGSAGVGGQFTQSVQLIPVGGIQKPFALQTVNTPPPNFNGSNWWSGVMQSIEGINCYDMVGQASTISFLFQASITGTYSVILRDGPATYTFAQTFNAVAGVVQKVVIPVPASPLAASMPYGVGLGASIIIGGINNGVFGTPNTGVWQAGNFISVLGATAWGLTAGATIAATDIQWEAGTNPNPVIEKIPFGQQFLNCQRYYQTLTDFLCGGYQTAGALVYADCVLPVPMRVTASGVLLSAASYFNASGYALNAVTANKFRINVTISAAGYGYGYGAALGFIAEL